MLLAKLFCRLVKEKQALWAKVLCHKYENPLKCEEWVILLPCLAWYIVWLQILQSHAHVLYENMVELGINEMQQMIEQLSVGQVYEKVSLDQGGRDKVHWRKIWKCNGPTRYSMMLWQARLDKLPTNNLMFNRGYAAYSLCPVCSQEEESSLHHALRDSARVFDVWKKFFAQKDWTEFQSCSSVKE